MFMRSLGCWRLRDVVCPLWPLLCRDDPGSDVERGKGRGEGRGKRERRGDVREYIINFSIMSTGKEDTVSAMRGVRMMRERTMCQNHTTTAVTSPISEKPNAISHAPSLFFSHDIQLQHIHCLSVIRTQESASRKGKVGRRVVD
jgi:hypothetical protein